MTAVYQNIAENSDLQSHPLYPKIKQIVEKIGKQNLFSLGSGYCWAMCDVVYNMLKQAGIKSRITEVELTIASSNPPAFHVIGVQSGNHYLSPNQVNTHIVLIIEHDIPLFFDGSIKGVLPDNKDYVLAFVNESDDNSICSFIFIYMGFWGFGEIGRAHV